MSDLGREGSSSVVPLSRKGEDALSGDLDREALEAAAQELWQQECVIRGLPLFSPRPGGRGLTRVGAIVRAYLISVVPEEADLDAMVEAMLSTIFPTGNRPDTPLRHALEDGALHAALCVLFERGFLSASRSPRDLEQAVAAGKRAILTEIGDDGWQLRPRRGNADRHVGLGQALALAFVAAFPHLVSGPVLPEGEETDERS